MTHRWILISSYQLDRCAPVLERRWWFAERKTHIGLLNLRSVEPRSSFGRASADKPSRLTGVHSYFLVGLWMPPEQWQKLKRAPSYDPSRLLISFRDIISLICVAQTSPDHQTELGNREIQTLFTVCDNGEIISVLFLKFFVRIQTLDSKAPHLSWKTSLNDLVLEHSHCTDKNRKRLQYKVRKLRIINIILLASQKAKGKLLKVLGMIGILIGQLLVLYAFAAGRMAEEGSRIKTSFWTSESEGDPKDCLIVRDLCAYCQRCRGYIHRHI